jgi:steroid delta-isomerase-like uncharacterized protein
MRSSDRFLLTRRSALVSFGVVGSGFVGPVRGAAVAQEASPAASTEDLPEIIQAWVAATAAMDAAALAALYTPDAFFESVPTAQVAHGSDEIRAVAQGQFQTYSDTRITVSSVFQAADWIVAEVTWSGRYTGQIEGMQPGAGQPISIRIASIFELDGGLIRRESDYYDALSFATQLGMFGPPEASPTS